MRVISQDGTMDVPYEISSFSMAVWKYENVEHAVIFCYNYSTSMGTKMAEYGSKEKAKKAMEMLRDTYQYGKRVAVPKFDESGIDKEDDITLYNTRLINDFFKGGTYVPTKVFQFPKDEDVEINNGLE